MMAAGGRDEIFGDGDRWMYSCVQGSRKIKKRGGY